MRIQSGKASDTAEMDDDGGDPAGSAGATVLAAKGRVVTHVAKKNLVQHAVPIFIELKRLLENKNSPLMGSLMDCLRVLLKDYKNEIDEILVADKQLQKELIYDMEKYEAAKAKSTVAEAMAANAQQYQTFSSPANRVVSGSGVFAKLSEKLGSGGKIGLAVADAAARVTAKSVLREANQSMSMGRTLIPSKSMPRVRTSGDGRVSNGASVQQANVLDSLRRRKMFVSDDDED